MAGQGYSEKHSSIDGSANAFVEVAGLLHAGRVNLATATLARVPHAHPEIGAAVADLTAAIDDRGRDAVDLLSALSTRLRDTARGYAAADAETQAEFDALLGGGVFTPGQPGQHG